MQDQLNNKHAEINEHRLYYFLSSGPYYLHKWQLKIQYNLEHSNEHQPRHCNLQCQGVCLAIAP